MMSIQNINSPTKCTKFMYKMQECKIQNAKYNLCTKCKNIKCKYFFDNKYINKINHF